MTLLAGILGGFQLSNAAADVFTNSQDSLRSGWDSAEPNLPPATVTGSGFGQLFSTQVNGQVYAQPLVVGSTVLVSTENNYIYGLDAVTGATKWSRSLGAPWPASTTGCADLTPNLGNTSTGVFDPATQTYYLTTKVNDGPDAQHPNWYLHAVDVTNGAERTGWPVKIAGTPSNDPSHPFVGYDVNQRPGLLLLGGVVYMAFGAQCDYGTYVGWVVGVNTGTKAMNIWSDESGATSRGAGIWQSGSGLVSDGADRIFLATGNGITPPNGPGTNPPNQLSQSVVRLGVAADGTLSAKDFFSPTNAATLDQNDQDLGSGGPVALPSQYFGTAAVPNLMFQMGKDGRFFLLNRDNLGGKAQGAGGTDAVVQTGGPYRGVWGRPAVYGGEGGYLYIVQNQQSMLAFKYGVDGSGKPALSLAGNSTESFGYTSGSPVVTSNGTNAGSAVVWVQRVDGPTGANGQLCAYNAIPVNQLLPLLRCFPIGTAVKFATPATSNGRVYVGTRDGKVFGFGQPTTAALTTAQNTFAQTLVGTTGTTTVKVTATRPITINAITTSAPFAVTPPALPLSLAAGESIDVPATFTPTAPGSTPGVLSFNLIDGGMDQLLPTGLQGNAYKPGLAASPPTLQFEETPVGGNLTLSASFTNTGITDETVSAVTGPSGPFTVTGLPAAGATVAAGQSVAVSVTYTPTAAGTNTSSITVTSGNGTATMALQATAVVGVAQLSITPASVNFGSVPVGLSATKTLTVSNTGNLAVTVTKAAPPALPYVVNTPLPEGQVLAPGDTIQVQVTFAPSMPGTYNNVYTISSNDGNGAHAVPVTGSSTNPPSGTPLPSLGGGWVFNGSAKMSGSDLSLTPATSNQAGSAVYATPLPSAGLTASFQVQLGPGGGADGMTFAMLDAASATATSLGQAGSGLGFRGLNGVAVTLDTYKGGNDPSNNFIGLTTGAVAGQLTYVATATNIPALRTGTHNVVVKATTGNVDVTIDGTQVLSAAVSLPGSVLAAFTGATGGSADEHWVRNVTISSGTTLLPQPGTGWIFNGSAAMAGNEAVLTPATNMQAGSAFYSQTIATDGMTAAFTLRMNGGSGADGATFALIDPAQAPAGPASVGAKGSGLGFAGLPGVAVVFDTFAAYGVNSYNWVGIGTSTAGGAMTLLASTTSVPQLRVGTHSINISISGTTITLKVDGNTVLTKDVPGLPATALAGFTAGNGGMNDVHAVSSAQIVAGASLVPSPPAAGWTANGAATISGGSLQLTPADVNKAGTAIFGQPIPTARLNAKFTAQLNGGTGADGMTFMLLDAAQASPTSLGTKGGGLGFATLPGVAVTLVTYPQPGVNSTNFIGIATSTAGGAISYASSSTAIPLLRSGTHAVEVSVVNGNLVVSLDGTQVLNTKVSIPAYALAGFSGGTGGMTDIHAASNISIRY
ncbi:choice-of-anchor D domain-containing protein [Dactylosporangium sp. NPDC051484]|uniref:choice-of-anchor D domain-containing protein n=1 Tax=Dactylosporangium sp. NPDC051484 TaxID=3154942 RepID=UPI00344C97F3